MLVRDAPSGGAGGTFASVIADVATRAEQLLVAEFSGRGFDAKTAPMYARMLVGAVAMVGEWWLEHRTLTRQQVASPRRQPAVERPQGPRARPRRPSPGRQARQGRAVSSAGHRGASADGRAVAPLVPRLRGFGTTVFSEMTALAVAHDAVNLGQGFPDADPPVEVLAAAEAALRAGHNQYAPGPGIEPLRRAIADHQAAPLWPGARPGHAR